MEKYQNLEQGAYSEVHHWRPPCSCGVELNEALKMESSPKVGEKEEVHCWRPPCSCGVSLEKISE